MMSSISSVGGFIQSKLQASFKRNRKSHEAKDADEMNVQNLKPEMKYLELREEFQL